MDGIEDKILGVIGQRRMPESEIGKELGISYETLIKYLKDMTNRGVLGRRAMQVKSPDRRDRKPYWTHVYHRNIQNIK